MDPVNMNYGFPFEDVEKEDDIILDSIPFQLDEDKMSIKRPSEEISNQENSPSDSISMPVIRY